MRSKAAESSCLRARCRIGKRSKAVSSYNCPATGSHCFPKARGNAAITHAEKKGGQKHAQSSCRRCPPSRLFRRARREPRPRAKLLYRSPGRETAQAHERSERYTRLRQVWTKSYRAFLAEKRRDAGPGRAQRLPAARLCRVVRRI